MSEVSESKPRCKYCAALLDSEGFCTRVCRPGLLVKRLAEIRKRIAGRQQKQTEQPA